MYIISQLQVIKRAVHEYVCIGVGAALSQLGWWGGTILMGEVGPILLSSPLRTPGTFYVFAGTFALVFLHVLLLLPETKVSAI